MKKIMEKIENSVFSTREYMLIGAVLFMAGLLIGLIFSPKGDRTISTNNNSNNSGLMADDLEDICAE